MSIGSTIHFFLTERYLVAANTGQPFTPEGLEAICAMHISAKRGQSFSSLEEARQQIEETRLNWLNSYQNNITLLKEQKGQVRNLPLDYRHRTLLELMQNADDAAGGQPIGYKGVGFKSILNLTRAPRIHSGYLHCKFDPDLCREAFSKEGLPEEGAELLVLRLPFEASLQDEPPEIQELAKLYDTVIVLPFTDENASERFLQEWEKTQGDIRLLLFLHRLEKVIWERQGNRELIWHCRRHETGTELTTNPENEEIPAAWKVFRRGQDALAVPTDSKGMPVRVLDYPTIRVFFPTEEPNPLPFLVHIYAPLDHGRKHIHLESENEEVVEALQNLSALACELLSNVPHAGLWLDLLCPRTAPDSMGGFERLLWQAVVTEVKKCPIPETDGLTLESVRLCPDEDVLWSWRGRRFELWSRFKELIAKHRSGNLNSLPFLPPGVDNEDRERTILSINPNARLSAEGLRKLPLLPVEGSNEPVSPAETTLFWPPGKEVQNPPGEIRLRFLSRRFIEGLNENSDTSEPLKNFLIETLVVGEFKYLEVIKRAILPVLREGHQPQGLLEFLRDLVEPTLKKEDLTFDWTNSVRKEIAELCYVPTREGKIRQAIEVYAGDDWTEDKLLERIYGNGQDRSFLEPPPEDEKERERWERFYLWLGVGWCPKVLPIVLYEPKPNTREGPQWQGKGFPIKNPPPYWVEHCRELDGGQNYRRKARLRQDWKIDGGEKVLTTAGVFKCINDNWSYYKQYVRAVFYRSSNVNEDYDNDLVRKNSYLTWLFKNIEWVPAKGPTNLQKASEVFVPGEVLNRLRGLIFEGEGEVGEDFRQAIGIRKDWEELTDKDWHGWFEHVTRWDPAKNMNLQKTILSLYRAALNNWHAPKGDSAPRLRPWEGPIWAVESRPDGSKVWELKESRNEVFYLDRPDLVDLRLEGLWVFPVHLGHFEAKAERLFKLERLSRHLIGEPEPASSNTYFSDILILKRDKRLPFIRAYLSKNTEENSLREMMEAMVTLQVHVVQELRVNFNINNRPLDGQQDLEAFYDNTQKAVWLDSKKLFTKEKWNPKKYAWEWLARSLVYCSGLLLGEVSNIKDLLTYSDRDLERKLLDLGLTQHDIDELEIQDELPTGEVLEEPTPVEEEYERPEEVYGPHTLPRPPFPPAERPLGEPTIQPPGPRVPRPRDPKYPLAPSPGSDQERREKGKEAEEWIREELRRRLTDTGWEISDTPERDSEGRESDIVLRHEKFGEFHIESKHMEAGPVYWSEKQVDKARDLGDHYFIVILEPEGDDYQEYWLDNPLRVLLDFNRDGTWVWHQHRKDKVPLTTSGWEVPEERPVLTENPPIFYFHILIERNKLQQIAHDFTEIRTKLEQRN